jgi:predicted transcriptional regulator
VYTTVKTYLDRLVQKGYIHGQPSGDGRGTYGYTAAVSREAVHDHPDLLARFIRVFHLTLVEFLRGRHIQGLLSQQDKAAVRALVHDMPDEAPPPISPRL